MLASYEICLADYESILPKLACIIQATYEAGAFSKAEEEFHGQSLRSKEWRLSGERGSLTVTLEEYEGYYFSKFEALGAEFQEGKVLLWENYLKQGGNPNAQEKP